VPGVAPFAAQILTNHGFRRRHPEPQDRYEIHRGA
jgi:hypothetical protein